MTIVYMYMYVGSLVATVHNNAEHSPSKFIQKWSKVRTSQKPRGRAYHAACVIGSNTGHHPLVMVVGGFGGTALSDVWLLDVTDGSWSEV